jgi:hypothetical protein
VQDHVWLATGGEIIDAFKECEQAAGQLIAGTA